MTTNYRGFPMVVIASRLHANPNLLSCAAYFLPASHCVRSHKFCATGETTIGVISSLYPLFLALPY